MISKDKNSLSRAKLADNQITLQDLIKDQNNINK